VEAARKIESAGVLQWVRPACQERSRKALTNLLDAAERLVSERGFEDTSVQEIASAAGTSVGSFYRRFKDKHGLLQAIHARFSEEARATADAALDPARWADKSAAQMVAAIALFLVDIVRGRRGLFRAFLVTGASDPVVRAREVELTGYLTERLAACLESRRGELRHDDVPLAARTTLLLLTGTLSHAVIVGPGELDIDDPATARELARAACRYVGTELPTETE
jgi:AcrR family transcriptional regulator